MLLAVANTLMSIRMETAKVCANEKSQGVDL